jgi:hypothetical protein
MVRGVEAIDVGDKFPSAYPPFKTCTTIRFTHTWPPGGPLGRVVLAGSIAVMLSSASVEAPRAWLNQTPDKNYRRQMSGIRAKERRRSHIRSVGSLKVNTVDCFPEANVGYDPPPVNPGVNDAGLSAKDIQDLTAPGAQIKLAVRYAITYRDDFATNGKPKLHWTHYSLATTGLEYPQSPSSQFEWRLLTEPVASLWDGGPPWNGSD